LDVHQGNGTAHIFDGSSQVFTLSMHAENNYPFKKEKSTLDIPLQDGLEDHAYLACLDENLKYLLETFKPEFVYYQAGVDVLATDKLGRLSLTIDRKSTRLNSSHVSISYAVFCLKKRTNLTGPHHRKHGGT